MTRLCVPIFVTELDKARRDIALATEAGADLVELRIDTLEDAGVLETLLRENAATYVVTCRPTWEGGMSERSDEDRAALLADAVDKGAAYIDLEWKALGKLNESMELQARHETDLSRVIASSHDFSGRPPRLTSIVQEMFESEVGIAKVAWAARSVRDNIEAFEILRHRQKPTIALCMGEHGIISRILAKKFGAFLTFAALTKDGGTAPGQVTIDDMKRLYRWDALGPATRIYGVVASPVMHSMSPAIHNAAFEATGHDGLYLPLLVNEGYESFKAFMETFLEFEPLHLSGLSVTLPHKENALRYLKEKNAEIEPLAESIGAVNTIAIESGKLRGLNTDYPAILDSITTKLEVKREQLSAYRFAVIGAGGTGRTAVAALAHYGATVVVYNRTLQRAEALAKEFTGKRGKVVAAAMEKLCDSCCHVYINTTSVGMHPNVDASPLGEKPPLFTAETLVFDTIYNPMQTKLLRLAEAAGAKTIGGVEMFVRQAAAQFQAWTALPAPTEVMRQVVERRLTAK